MMNQRSVEIYVSAMLKRIHDNVKAAFKTPSMKRMLLIRLLGTSKIPVITRPTISIRKKVPFSKPQKGE